ncbi:hypothetical protein EVAR_6053_1 [Eumeta japonica]|uniref:Uncharacterized protein n=1 Tax=Eumeta variegata TaxID=151549 RepID=A0A4C1TAU5_EUMVA|nr:hypothetical protein EVAR_6053_1 [Eumeta japonica]
MDPICWQSATGALEVRQRSDKAILFMIGPLNEGTARPRGGHSLRAATQTARSGRVTPAFAAYEIITAVSRRPPVMNADINNAPAPGRVKIRRAAKLSRLNGDSD